MWRNQNAALRVAFSRGVGLLGVKVMRPSGSVGHLCLSGEKVNGFIPRYYSTCNIEIHPVLLDSK